MYFKKNWGSMVEKDPLSGRIDIFQTSPNHKTPRIQRATPHKDNNKTTVPSTLKRGNQIRYKDKSLKAVELAKTAAEMTHTVYTANRKSQKAFDAIGTRNKITMWNTLQEYLREYSNYINNTSWITGLYLYRVDQNFYEQTTVEDMEKPLRIEVPFRVLENQYTYGADDSENMIIHGDNL